MPLPWEKSDARDAASAERMQKAQQQVFNLFPADSVIGDPVRRQQFGEGVTQVTEYTVVYNALAVIAPGRVGRSIAAFYAGRYRDPHAGKLRPGSDQIGNYAPSPAGYLPPEAVGLEPNWWLPTGSTNYIPGVVDQLGYGLPEQRRIDERARQQAFNAQWDSRTQRARQVLANESDDTLRAILSDPAVFSHASRVVTSHSLDPLAARIEARRQLAIRALPAPPQVIDQLAEVNAALAAVGANRNVTLAELEAVRAAIQADREAFTAEGRAAPGAAGNPLDPLRAATRNGSIQPQRIPARTAAAIRQLLNAVGINRELVTERLDP